jgi:hypothetical protein
MISRIPNRPIRQHHDPQPESLLSAAIGIFIVIIAILVWIFFLDGLGG